MNAAPTLELAPIHLPAPRTNGGMPLLRALYARRTIREFRPEMLPAPILSDLLWAAFGVSHAADGRRTAPSACNARCIDIYVASAAGVHLYDAAAGVLEPVVGLDIRMVVTRNQKDVQGAPAILILVADPTRLGKLSEADRTVCSIADAGYIGENIYLFCASEGLATVAVGAMDRAAVAKALRLSPEKFVVLAHPVGRAR